MRSVGIVGDGRRKLSTQWTTSRLQVCRPALRNHRVLDGLTPVGTSEQMDTDNLAFVEKVHVRRNLDVSVRVCHGRNRAALLVRGYRPAVLDPDRVELDPSD